jgi:hypothetical protein
MLDDKLVFAELMARAGLPHMEIYGICIDGRWRWKPEGRARATAALACGPVVLKTLQGSNGEGFRLVWTAEELDAPAAENSLAGAYVRAAPYAREIFAKSLNTLRVLTFREPGGDPEIGAALHRFGAERTGSVDNFAAGGLVAEIDPASGRLATALYVGDGNRIRETDHHPDTGAPIAGVVVPGWPEVRATVLRAMHAFPYLRYVGWDVAVAEDGVCLIEGNNTPFLAFFLYRPLLRQAPLARFIRAYMR